MNKISNIFNSKKNMIFVCITIIITTIIIKEKCVYLTQNECNIVYDNNEPMAQNLITN